MRRKLRAVRSPIWAAALLAVLAVPSAVAVAGTSNTTSMNYRANLRAYCDFMEASLPVGCGAIDQA